MNDHELLELAAKAAGIEGGWGERVMIGQDEVDLTEIWFLDEPENCAIWDPLTDDGDALRLAVKLCMNVEVTESDVYACTQGNFSEPAKPDCAAATRRAIVRAAAAIGEAMP